MILVTGANGMLGRAAVSQFLQSEERVRAHGRSNDMDARELFKYDEQAHDLECASADFLSLDLNAAMALCEGCSTVVHSAGLVHKVDAAAELYQRLNVDATRFLAEAARKSGVKQFIFISSSSVYGNRATNMISESEALQGDTPYAASKIDAETYLRENPPAPSTVVLRPSLVFGEGDRGNMISLIRQVLSGKYFIVGEGSARKSLIDSADLARALALVLGDCPSGYSVFNLANPEPVSIKQLSEQIIAAAGRSAQLLSMPPWVVSAAAGAANAILGKRSPLSADRLDKLTRENSVSVASFISKFNFSPQFDLQAALLREIDWAREAKLL
jgi:nucleoside-diphosphate-sugar epimerase